MNSQLSYGDLDNRLFGFFADGLRNPDIHIGAYEIVNSVDALQGMYGEEVRVTYTEAMNFSRGSIAIGIKMAVFSECNLPDIVYFHQTPFGFNSVPNSFLDLPVETEWLLAFNHPDEGRSLGDFQELVINVDQLGSHNFFSIYNIMEDPKAPYSPMALG